MKRRGFFGALAGLAGGAVVARAATPVADPAQEEFKRYAEKRRLVYMATGVAPVTVGFVDTAFTVGCPVGTPLRFDSHLNWDD